MVNTPPGRAAPEPLRRLIAPFTEFARTGALGGVALLVTTAIALVWANSPWAASYHHLWEQTLSIGPTSAPLTMTLHHWINDGLMTVFFLVVGLEIKRELSVGELCTPRQAALPIAGALGGMIVPALIYASVNAGGPGSRGWGVPMATDIAFALGVLALLGPRIPVGLKVFLTALAIVDDLGAVIVIAVFYTATLNITALLGAGVTIAVLMAFNRARVMVLWPYLTVGLVLWYFVLQSGVHATIAGVLLALTIPAFATMGSPEFSARARGLLDTFDANASDSGQVIENPAQQNALFALDVAASRANAPLLRIEHALHGVVSYGLMPIFALANAGVTLGAVGGALRTPVTWGVILGLCLGKFIGISLFAWAGVRSRLATLPTGVTWNHMRGAAVLGGIGFTMSIFIAGLAYGVPALNEDAKIGILIASTVSGVVGYAMLRFGGRQRTNDPAPVAALEASGS
ncbi:MAG: Na+/H+ antiporter NhaA [Cytophagaceae bacterium]|nr:Na+/H+ antiporter NhaA [Gemmatimonadaceae bacterium]